MYNHDYIVYVHFSYRVPSSGYAYVVTWLLYIPNGDDAAMAAFRSFGSSLVIVMHTITIIRLVVFSFSDSILQSVELCGRGVA